MRQTRNKPETTDCTLLIPVPRGWPDSNPDSAPRIALRLHREHLSAKSTFLRGLFSGVAPLDLIQSLAASCHQPSAPLHFHYSRLPRILPSPPSHPVFFLPVPDPSSIQLLFHWMYFGVTSYIESALDRGDVRWEGLVRNVEYLGLPTDIKVFLGHWYRTWFLPASCSSPCTPCPSDDELDDGDEHDNEDDMDSDDDDCPPTPPTDDDQRPNRGRTRDIKPLLQICKQLHVVSFTDS